MISIRQPGGALRATAPAIVLLTGAADAADHHVTPGQSIQAAIQVAASGDRVLVHPGAYAEAIDFLGKAIEVLGVGGPTVTTVDATGLGGPTVAFRAGETTLSVLRGFTVTGGAVAGIEAKNAATPIVGACLVTGNAVGVVAGSAADPLTELTLVDSVVSKNAGRGVSGRLTLDRCTVALNAGGGVDGHRLTLLDCLVAGNHGVADGAGVHSATGLLTAQRCVFQANRATQRGGGLFVKGALDLLEIERSSFVGNVAGTLGGGAYVEQLSDGGPVSILGIASSIFAGNVAGSSGGAVHATVSAPGAFAAATLRHLTLWGNQPDGSVVNGVFTLQVLDTIAWNQPSPFTVGPGGTVGVTTSDVQGGWIGTGNFSADPLLADPANGDFHLTAGSPCIGAAGSPVPADFEGDPPSGPPDVGADERGPHLSIHGLPTPGATVHVSIVGGPGSPVLLFAGHGLDPNGVPTAFGSFHLLPPTGGVSLGVVPASGVLGVPVPLPATLAPGGAAYAQAFLGPPSATLTNAASLRVH